MRVKHLTSIVLAASCGIASHTALADIELGEGLTVTGFIDMSFLHTDVDGSEGSSAFAVDQVETSFLYTGTEGVTAQVDIEYGESGTGNGEDETFVEQAFITKQINEKLSVKAGRFLSYSGWETEEPTGLYQYSGTGYAPVFYGFYQQGVSAFYDGGSYALMASFVNDAFANPVESDTDKMDTELGVAIMPMEGVTAKLFYITEENKDAINFWASYATGPMTYAFEYNTAEGTASLDSEADGYLLMASYAGDGYGVTFRYHAYEVEDATGATVTDNSAITIAPSFSVGDNLLIVTEARFDTNDAAGAADSNSFAVEALFTF